MSHTLTQSSRQRLKVRCCWFKIISRLKIPMCTDCICSFSFSQHYHLEPPGEHTYHLSVDPINSMLGTKTSLRYTRNVIKGTGFLSGYIYITDQHVTTPGVSASSCNYLCPHWKKPKPLSSDIKLLILQKEKWGKTQETHSSTLVLREWQQAFRFRQLQCITISHRSSTISFSTKQRYSQTKSLKCLTSLLASFVDHLCSSFSKLPNRNYIQLKLKRHAQSWGLYTPEANSVQFILKSLIFLKQ